MHFTRYFFGMSVCTQTDDAAVNAAEQQITLQLIAEPRIATTPSTIAQTASNELVVTAPEGCKQYHIKTLSTYT